jgi:transposase
MHKINYTKEEVTIFKNYYHSSNIELIRQKSHCHILRDKNFKEKEIAIILMRDLSTIQRWISEFYKIRLASLHSFKLGNENSSKLTREQKEEIKRILQEPVTEDSDLPKRFWDVPRLREYVSTQFSVEYDSRQSYHYLLKFSNLSFKYPERRDIRRNEELVQERMKEVKTETENILRKSDWEVFCADETRLQEDNLIRKAWLRKGEPTYIKVEIKKNKQNYIGFLNQRTFRCNLFEIEKGNQKNIIKAIVELKRYYPRKKLCIVWDNARFHKGKDIRKELRVGGKLENVYFVALPPYAPTENPIEHVWQSAKDDLSKIKFKEGFERMKMSFRALISARRFEFLL